MKKKIISLCLLGLATFGGINVFAASLSSGRENINDINGRNIVIKF